MKYNFFATGFVLAICCLVFLFIYSRPVPMKLRFNGTSYKQNKELDNDITISLEGNQHNKTFQKNKFTGYVTIISEKYPKDFDAVSLKFNKKGIGMCPLKKDGIEFGILTIDKKLESLSILITAPKYLQDGETLIAAPATDIEQAKSIIKQLTK